MKLIITLSLLVFSFTLSAKIQLPGLFSDGMVLQQKVKVPVWGWAAKDTLVKVAFGNQVKSTTVNDDGKWMLYLDPLKASAEPSEMKITVGTESIAINNVLVGEVWLCSGQSNMDFTIKRLLDLPSNKKNRPIANHIAKETAKAKDPLLRQILSPHGLSAFKEQEKFRRREKWIESSPANNGNFSATAYYFGRQLRQELGVPVGLIKSAYGGTLIQPWIPMHGYQQNEEMKKFYDTKLSDVKQKLKKWDEAKEKAQYAEKMAAWKIKKQEALAAKKSIPQRPRSPIRPDRNRAIPSTLYNSMISPLAPYAIKGVIWYQGESNAINRQGKQEIYAQYMTILISSWRETWKQGDFPFYFAQLANYSKAKTMPLENDPWATVCNQQRLTLRVKNTGMAVLNDIGDARDVHPKNKIDVGKRLALWALAKDYAKDIVYSGPLYEKSVFSDSMVTITFSSVGQGLMVGKKNLLENAVEVQESLKGFQICGADRLWKWAEAKIISKNQVEVFNSSVSSPVEVRYAWAKNAEGSNLYNKNGLPTSVFNAIK